MERAIQYTITSANTKRISIYKEEIQMVQLPGIEDLMNYEHGTAPKNYSFTSIFRTIACVGDSLASGEFELIDEEGKNHYYDRFEYSWGQFLARKIGSTVYNFSRGGMTAMEYCKSYARLKDYWNPDLKATYSYNFDLIGEYYFKSVGILSAGVFYKNLNNFIYICAI